MTFGETVVGITTITASRNSSGSENIYTVPAGRYAMVYVNGISIGGSATGTWLITADNGPSITGTQAAVNGERHFVVLLNAGQSLGLTTTMSNSGDLSVGVRGVALEFNSP